MDKMRDKIVRFMYGRYGQDEFSVALMITGMVLMVLSVLPKMHFLYAISFMCVVYAMYRTFSKDFNKRYKERNWYLKVSKKPSKFIRIQTRRFKERKTHDYYRCNKCGTYNRIPKGHGKILITCPKCSNQFERK